VEEVGRVAEQLGRLLLHHRLQQIGPRERNAVPRLGLPPRHIQTRGQIHRHRVKYTGTGSHTQTRGHIHGHGVTYTDTGSNTRARGHIHTPYHVLGSPLDTQGHKHSLELFIQTIKCFLNKKACSHAYTNVPLYETEKQADLPMEVVDGVAPVILGMPAKTGKAHAHVTPRNLQT
jgi:hypothetical protein